MKHALRYPHPGRAVRGLPVRVRGRWLGMLLAVLVATSVQAEILVVVHPDNPVTTLSRNDVRKIFMGKQRLFPDSRTEIRVIDQAEPQAVFVQFYQQLLSMDPARLANYRAAFLFSGKGRLPEVVPDDRAVIERIRQDPAAIGYLSAPPAAAEVRTVFTLEASSEP